MAHRLDRARSEALREEVGHGLISTDYQEVLIVDAISICTPHDLHASVAIAGAEAGKHVLVEKPLAATLEQADRMIEVAAQAGSP